MKLSRELCEKCIHDAPKYEAGIQFVQSGINDKSVHSLNMWLSRMAKKNDGVSYLLCDSEHDSHQYIEKTVVKTGKPGRPKTEIKGRKIGRHVHGVIISENPVNNLEAVKKNLQHYLHKRKKNNAELKQAKVTSLNVSEPLFLIQYMDRQSAHVYRGGDFDFDYYLNPFYFDYYKR